MSDTAIQVTTERLDDGSFFVESVWTPGCWGQGSTEDEAIRDFVDAYQSWKELGVLAALTQEEGARG